MSYAQFATAGTCQYCDCTEDSPCRLRSGDCCWWLLKERNVCTRPGCVERYYAERPRPPRKLTTADVHALKLAQRRRRPKKPVKRPLGRGGSHA